LKPERFIDLAFQLLWCRNRMIGREPKLARLPAAFLSFVRVLHHILLFIMVWIIAVVGKAGCKAHPNHLGVQTPFSPQNGLDNAQIRFSGLFLRRSRQRTNRWAGLFGDPPVCH